MAIGLTAKQKSALAAMLPNVDESVLSLKRLIADAKDRTRALAKLADAEEAQKRHAQDVGIPFNADAFARRRAELHALPAALTVEEGQLAAFTALQRAIGVVAEGPYVREGRGATPAGERSARKQNKAVVRKKASAAGKPAARRPASGKKASGKKASGKKGSTRNGAGAKTGRASSKGGAASTRSKTKSAEQSAKAVSPVPASPRVKPMPLSLGS